MAKYHKVLNIILINFITSLIQKQSPICVLQEMFSEKCSKYTREQPCGSVISVKLHTNFIETTPPDECSPVTSLLEQLFWQTPMENYFYKFLFTMPVVFFKTILCRISVDVGMQGDAWVNHGRNATSNAM